MNPNTKRALVRAFRTFIQAFIGAYLAIVTTSDPGTFAGLADTTALEAGAVAGFIAVLSFTQNFVEGKRNVRYERG